MAKLLSGDQRIRGLQDTTRSYDTLDFRFQYRGEVVNLDVKEKRQRYTRGFRELRPEKSERDLFIVDETVYRRIVWQGGGGYLVVHDVPENRWVMLGPWELTLGDHIRFGRWGQRRGDSFLKGKLLVDLACAGVSGPECSVDLVTRAIDHARSWRDRVDPYPVPGSALPEVGRSPA